MGLLWLSTVAPTNGIIAVMFGTRWLATLAGLAFFSHQVGGFLGVWLGGVVFEHTGSYDAVWWLSVLFGVLSAVINLPIVEKPVRAWLPLRPDREQQRRRTQDHRARGQQRAVVRPRPASSAPLAWRTPVVILVCGCLIGMLGFGPRSGLAFFLTPMSSANGWGRDVFALALAIQMLLWGAAQPFAGAIADRYGAVPVLSAGAMLYALGLAAMAYADTPPMLHLTAGVIIGFGLAGASFTIVIGAFGKLMPPEWRTIAFGAGTAAGSFGQFLFSPLAVALIDRFGWQHTLLIFAAIVLLIMPLSLALAAPRQRRRGRGASRRAAAIGGAGAHRGVRPHAATCCSCSASSPAASRSSSSPCTCRPIWSTAGFRPRSAAGRSPPSACSTSSARSAPAGSPT